MTYLITVRATDAAAAALSPPAPVRIRCNICGEEVCVPASSQERLQDFPAIVICTVCFAQLFNGIPPECRRCVPSEFFRRTMVGATTSAECNWLQGKLRKMCRQCDRELTGNGPL